MQAIAQGDRHAFEQLLQRHVDPLYNYALRLSGCATNADDLIQDTWLTVWQKAGSFRSHKASVSTWLHRIVHNRFIDQTRRKANRLEVTNHALPELPDEQTNNDEHERGILWQALGDLAPNQRAVLVLRYAQGFGNPQIATITGSSTRAVESLLARAKRALKSAMNERQQTDTL